MLASWKKSYDEPRQLIKKQRHYFANKGSSSQNYVFFFPVVTYGCESWPIKRAPKNWCFWTVLLENTLESLLDSKEIKPVNPKGNQPWIFIGRTVAETEAPILWPPDARSRNWKRPRWWERLRAGGEEGNRGWDDWMASLTQWTWVWANSRRWQGTGKPCVL